MLGFYLNATQAPWNSHYKMYDYIVNELPKLIETHFPANERRALLVDIQWGTWCIDDWFA